MKRHPITRREVLNSLTVGAGSMLAGHWLRGTPAGGVVEARAATASAAPTDALAALDERLTPRRALFPFRGGVPVVYAYGTPYERGAQIGRQLRTFDPHAMKEVAAIRWRLMMRDIPGVTRDSSLSLVDEYLTRVRTTLGAEIVDEYLAEMRGVADGYKLSHDEMFMLALGGHYRKFFIDQRTPSVAYAEPGDGCSSFAAWGKATADGEMIATHNCDWPRMPDRSMMVAVVMAPERGHRLVYADTIGTWGSHHIVSEKLFIAGLALGRPKAKSNSLIPGGPNGLYQRWIAQYARSASEALDMLKSRGVDDRGIATPAGSLVYVDAREAIYLQATPDRIGRIPNKDGYNAVTNHLLVDDMAPLFETRRAGAGTESRLKAVEQQIAKHYGRIDIPVAAGIMSSHYDPGAGRDNVFVPTPCDHGEYRGESYGTNLSTLVKLSAQTVWFALGNPCTAGYTRIRIGSAAEIRAAADAALAHTD
jgi:hypothetical protein